MQVWICYVSSIQVKFAQEEGIGQGPTNEFVTLFGDEIQRRELHLWRDETPTPCTFSTVVRLLNCPYRGPGEGVVLNECTEDISGAILRCYSCACLNMWICPEHKCLLSVDRLNRIVRIPVLRIEILFCRDCSYTMPVAELKCDSCGMSSDCFQFYWFGFKRQEINELLEWFQNHPAHSSCCFGTIICSICDVVSFPFKSTSFEEWSQNIAYPSSHNHGNHVYSFQCIVRK